MPHIKARDVEAWRKKMRDDPAEALRRETSKELYEIFSHKWKELLAQKLLEKFTTQTYEQLLPHLDTAINALRWSADELAKIYAKPPTRSIAGIESVKGEVDPLDPYTAEGALDMALDQAARLCFAVRSVALGPLVAEGSNHIVLDVIPPHRVYVVPGKIDKTRLDLIVIHRSNGDFEAWDAEEKIVVDAHYKTKSIDPNPYKVVPYMVALAAHPTLDYWQTSESFGLRDAAYFAALGMTEHNYLRHWQSFKQGWYHSDDAVPLTILSDPSSWLHVTGLNASVGAIDLQANLTMHLETLLDALAAKLGMYGIRPETTRGTLFAQSGFAYSLKLQTQEAVWEKQRMIWELWERRLYELSQVVLQVDAQITMPSGKLMIEWADLGAKSSKQEQALLARTKIQDRVWSVQHAQRLDGLTPEEIEQIEDEILESGVGMAIPAMDEVVIDPGGEG